MLNEELFAKFLKHLDDILIKQSGGDNHNDTAASKS